MQQLMVSGVHHLMLCLVLWPCDVLRLSIFVSLCSVTKHSCDVDHVTEPNEQMKTKSKPNNDGDK